MSTLIVGCGYLGLRVGRQLVARGEEVYGTTRSDSRREALKTEGIRPILVDVLDVSTLNNLREVDRVVYCVSQDRASGSDPRAIHVDGLTHVLERLVPTTRRLIYASSTGVYGQGEGEWVDEQSQADPEHEAGQICLEAEQLVREWSRRASVEAVVLRYAGLYGPGRVIRRTQIERGEPISGIPENYLNLIHIDDAAAAAVAALDAPKPRDLYLACDDRPIPRRDYYGLLARLIGAPAPRFAPPRSGRPEGVRERANRRVSNRRIRSELGLELAYPDITTGLPAALASG